MTIRQCLDAYLHALPHAQVAAPPTALSATSDPAGDIDTTAEHTRELWDLMARVGRAVGRMHEIGVVHGDLTTSNLLLRPLSEAGRPAVDDDGDAALPGGPADAPTGATAESTADLVSLTSSLQGTVYLIDFGLSQQTVQDEDKAVDLYVLERAFSATHPAAEGLFKEVLRVYAGTSKGAKGVLKRLEDVRLRGRKRSMIG